MENEKKCRICGGTDLVLKLDLGSHPPSDGFLTKEQLSEPEIHYPLQLYLCKTCLLVQIGYSVPPTILFGKDYPYETGVNEFGIRHFKETAKTVYNRFKPRRVVDIGSNDGTLLEAFEALGCDVLGVEPVRGIAEKAKVKTLCGFWGKDISLPEKVDIITACNVFAHVPDLHGFVKQIKKSLVPNGVFVFENPFLYDMMNGFEFDTIYHEHLCYFSPKPLQYLFKMHDMVIFDMERLPYIHGGSMRYYVGRRGEFIQTTISHENFVEELLDDFAKGVVANKIALLDMLWKLKSDGNRIVAVSAPAKGNTLLNYCNIGPEILDYVTEKSKLKIGRFTPGQHIPVVSDDVFHIEAPYYALLLAWNWKDQIKLAFPFFRGKWIVPLPEPHFE